MHRRVLIAIVCGVVYFGTTSFAQEQRKPPKKPDRPFMVYVYTEGLTNEDVDMPKVAEEVSKRVAKKKKWLKIVNDRESADIIIEVLTHLVHEQHRMELDTRVNDTGTGKTYYDSNWITERHRIETRVTFPSGAQKMFTGADERDRGGSMKGAAGNLAKQLENYCKENYWNLVAS
ncbi:MAG: hypothetical protein BMS9Abin37_0606 [Acidobacteriota bacterium]|nr:MAG: hypothetical protein BMS9Abin37_0606 [Acidobacteriota bacterium]